VSVALTIGLRRGVVLGLRWPATDLEDGMLSVSHQAQRQAGQVALRGIQDCGKPANSFGAAISQFQG
jgi:hypothetical protein